MKIVAGFSALGEILPLAKAGADELYCAIGALPYFGESKPPGPGTTAAAFAGRATEARGPEAPSGVLAPASASGMETLRTAVRRAHALGLKLSVAVNRTGPALTLKRAARLLDSLVAADAAGVDAFIITNPAMLTLLAGLKPLSAKIHLSSVQPCFNSLTAGFFIDRGISRIILPNQLSPFEARKILKLCRRRGVETEIFDYRFFGCAYINGRCHLHSSDYHTLTSRSAEGSLCRVNIPVSKSLKPVHTRKGAAAAAAVKTSAWRLSARLACGGAPRMANPASFFDFFCAGIGYLKYGTRKDSAEVKERNVRNMRAMLDLAESLIADLGVKKARAAFIGELSFNRFLPINNRPAGTKRASHAD